MAASQLHGSWSWTPCQTTTSKPLDLSDLTTNNYYIYSATQKLNNNYYLLTHTRAPSWLIGLLCGVFIQQFKHKPFKIPNIPAVCLWILSLAALLTCTFGGYATLQNAEYRRLDHALYIALTRPAFSLALCWVIIGCVFGCGGILKL